MIAAEREGLLRDVPEDPADDGARLRFADWCEDAGQYDRAEFIRLQIALWNAARDCSCGRNDGVHLRSGGQHTNGGCAADKLRWPPGDGRTRQARIVERELLDANVRWAEPAARACGIGGGAHADYGHSGGTGGFRWEWRRGFLDSISLPLAAFMAGGYALPRRLFAEHPITAVTLVDRQVNTAADPPGWLEAHPNWLDGQGLLRPGAGRHWLPGRLIPHEWKVKYRSRRKNEAYYGFVTEEAALIALSDACVSLGRSLAKLPALPPGRPAG